MVATKPFGKTLKTYSIDELLPGMIISDLEFIIEGVMVKIMPLGRSSKNYYNYEHALTYTTSRREVFIPNFLKRLSRQKYINLNEFAVSNIFNLIQTGKLFFQRLFVWIREGRYTPPRKPDKKAYYFLQLIVGEPGQKISLGKDARKGFECSQCGTFLLRTKDHKIDEINASVCPYCQKLLQLHRHERRYQKLAFDPAIEPHWISYDHLIQMNVIYHNTSRPVHLNSTERNQFLRLFQRLNKGMIGPFSLQFFGDTVVKIIPMQIEDTTWHEGTIFPEDMMGS